MLKTPEELRQDLGQAIRMRRIGQRLSQEESAKHAGMSLSTWKRMEVNGLSSVEHLINAAITLRCEEGLSQLFPPPAASSMDELLKRQTATADQKSPKRVRRRKVGS